MRLVLSGKTTRPMVGALIALSTWLVVGSGQARAGCERQHSFPWAERSSDVRSLFPEPLAIHDAEAASDDSDDHTHAPWRPLPCSGPSCSRSPAAPPSIPSFVAEPVVTQWADLRVDPALSLLDSRVLAPASSEMRPVFRGDSVFHPPRRAV